MNLSQLVRTAKTVVTANSPALLTGAAITGIVTTGILSARAGYKARGILDAEKARLVASVDDDAADTLADAAALMDDAPDLSLGQQIQLTWLTYAVPAVVGVSSMVSVAGAHLIHTRRQAALAGLYVAASTKLDDVQEKAEEMLGQKKAQQLRDHVAQKSIDRVESAEPDRFNHMIVSLPEGNQIMFDEWSGRPFLGSKRIVDEALAKVNYDLTEGSDATLNDFYEWAGLPSVPMGDFFGWSGEKIQLAYGSTTLPDGRSAVNFWFSRNPKDPINRR